MSILTVETRQTKDSLNHLGGDTLKQSGYGKANRHKQRITSRRPGRLVLSIHQTSDMVFKTLARQQMFETEYIAQHCVPWHPPAVQSTTADNSEDGAHVSLHHNFAEAYPPGPNWVNPSNVLWSTGPRTIASA